MVLRVKNIQFDFEKENVMMKIVKRRKDHLKMRLNIQLRYSLLTDFSLKTENADVVMKRLYKFQQKS